MATKLLMYMIKHSVCAISMHILTHVPTHICASISSSQLDDDNVRCRLLYNLPGMTPCARISHVTVCSLTLKLSARVAGFLAYGHQKIDHLRPVYGKAPFSTRRKRSLFCFPYAKKRATLADSS